MYFARTNGTENQEGPTTPEEGLNFFIEYWNDIDWDSVFSSIILFFMQLILTLIIFFILKKVGNYAIELVFKRYMKEEQTVPNRLTTL